MIDDWNSRNLATFYPGKLASSQEPELVLEDRDFPRTSSALESFSASFRASAASLQKFIGSKTLAYRATVSLHATFPG